MNSIGLIEYITSLPPFAQVILGVIVLGIMFAIFRRLIKFALSLAALVILGLVIFRLVQQ